MKKLYTVIITAIIILTFTGCVRNIYPTYSSDNANPVVSQTQESTTALPNAEPSSVPAASDTIGAESNANTANNKTLEAIGEDAAKAIALQHAGLKENEVSFVLVQFERDDGRTLYEVEFYLDMKEYDYEIDAYSGEVISYDFDAENYSPDLSKNQAPQINNQTAGVTISSDEAKRIALEKAGISESDTNYIKVSFEYDDGMRVYQIDFVSGLIEYEVEINANSGEIVEYSAESVYD